MATYYLIDNGRVRTFESAFNQANLTQLWKWVKVAPSGRAVYAEKESRWYRLHSNGWSAYTQDEPKAITMSRMVQAITKTTWKEITSEIPVDTF